MSELQSNKLMNLADGKVLYDDLRDRVEAVYTKPSGGIPATDLASAVQTSLGKADTAYQKPSGGIPSTDLASGVIPDISGKADKVQSATNGNFAGLDSNGNLTDSGHKHSDYLTSHQDISGKADKVQSATNGNFAALDSNGNLTDSGHKHSDYLTSHQDISGKADKANPVFTGSISLGRLANSTVGVNSVAEGYDNTASAQCSRADGLGTTASGNQSHAEGDTTTASGANSHAEGYGTAASGQSSHSEGSGTTASGDYAHSEGNDTTASGTVAHAEGDTTTASGAVAHSEGIGTVANHKSQHVFGEYNTADGSSAAATARGNYVEIVGNGTASNAKSNARALDWSGNEYLKGDVYVGCNADSSGGSKLIASPSSPATGSFLVYNGTAWVAQTLSTWQGGNY